MMTFLTERKSLLSTLAAAAIALSVTRAHAASISMEAFQPVLWGSPAVSSQFDQFSVQVSSSGTSADEQYLNVVRDDGTWVVQNLPVGYEPGTSKIATNVDSALFSSGAAYQTTLSAAPALNAPSFVSGIAMNLGAAVNYLANDPFGRTNDGAFSSPGLPSNLALNFAGPIGFSYHTGVPDLAQGPNECAPTSAANSLTWLNNTYNLGINMNTADIRDTLKGAGFMDTSPTTGTTDANFFTGKTNFTANLPIETHSIAGGPGGPSIANILKELQNGQDVELALSWGNGGGHWVTLVGLIQLGNTAGIWFNDPDDGQTQTNFSWLDGDNGFSIRSYGVLGGGNTVDLAVAQSVPEPSTFVLCTLGITCLLGYTGLRRARAA